MLVALVDILLEVLLRVAFEELCNWCWHGDLVLSNIVIKIIRSHDLGNANQLVIVIGALKERVHSEEHPCESASETPNVKRVVIELVVDQELWALVVARSNSHIVFL